MKWRTARRRFVSGRGGRDVRGKKSANGRCGKTIEAQPVSGQTCLIEPAQERPTTAMAGTWTWGPASEHCRNEPLQRQTCALSSSHSVEFGCDEFGRPGPCPLLSTGFCRAAVRRPEDPFVAPSRLSSTSGSPKSCGHRSAKPGSVRPPVDDPGQLLARKTAEARMTALHARGRPIAAHTPSSRADNRRLFFAPRRTQMRGG